jgi:2,3-dihydroxybenzoate-AMP ligase
MLSGFVPWPAERAARYRAKGYWEGITIFEMFERSAARDPQRTALVAGEVRMSYRDLADAARRLAQGFAAMGLQPLDRVVVQLPNTPSFVIAYLALTAIGAIPVMALRAHRRSEVLHFVRSSKALASITAQWRARLRASARGFVT